MLPVLLAARQKNATGVRETVSVLLAGTPDQVVRQKRERTGCPPMPDALGIQGTGNGTKFCYVSLKQRRPSRVSRGKGVRKRTRQTHSHTAWLICCESSAALANSPACQPAREQGADTSEECAALYRA